MGSKPMFYECDPQKNKECAKEYCYLSNSDISHPCHLTTHKQYAKDGAAGIPMDEVKWQ